jgi:hypothetical protein
MIKFGVVTVAEAGDLAFEAESLVNESFADQAPMSVVFEKASRVQFSIRLFLCIQDRKLNMFCYVLCFYRSTSRTCL